MAYDSNIHNNVCGIIYDEQVILKCKVKKIKKKEIKT